MASLNSSTWLSPPLDPRSRRAMSPKKISLGYDVTTSATGLRKSTPINPQTFGGLDSWQAALYSSFTPDGCFPPAVAVRDPLFRLKSEMSRQLARREIRKARAVQRTLAEQAHSECESQLMQLREQSKIRDSRKYSENADVSPVERNEIPLPLHPLVRPRPIARPLTAPNRVGQEEVPSQKNRRIMLWSVRPPERPIAQPVELAGEINSLLRQNIGNHQMKRNFTQQETNAVSRVGDDDSVRPLTFHVY